MHSLSSKLDDHCKLDIIVSSVNVCFSSARHSHLRRLVVRHTRSCSGTRSLLSSGGHTRTLVTHVYRTGLDGCGTIVADPSLSSLMGRGGSGVTPATPGARILLVSRIINSTSVGKTNTSSGRFGHVLGSTYHGRPRTRV